MKTKLLLFILLLGPITSEATTIPGFLVIRGTLTLNNNNPALATEVISWDRVTLNRAPSGAFAGLGNSISTSDLTSPWIFDPSTPTTPFLQFGGFTFNLYGIFNLVRFNDPFFKGFSLQATGDVMHAGFETTPISEFFSASRDLSRPHFQKNVNFFLSIGNPIVPDSGATVGLLGLSLACVELLRRFARQKILRP